jgi:hypothetical protein
MVAMALRPVVVVAVVEVVNHTHQAVALVAMAAVVRLTLLGSHDESTRNH